MQEVIKKIKDGIQYGIGIAIGMMLLNIVVTLLMMLLNFLAIAATFKHAVGV